jgi:hypothetical protein
VYPPKPPACLSFSGFLSRLQDVYTRPKVPLPRFTAILSEMIGMVKSPSSPWYSPTTRVILITAPPVDTATWGRRCARYDPPAPPNRTHEVTKSYADAAKQVAQGNSVPVVDLWTAVWDAAGQKEEGLHKYLPDGLHLNAAGYEVRPGPYCFHVIYSHRLICAIDSARSLNTYD